MTAYEELKKGYEAAAKERDNPIGIGKQKLLNRLRNRFTPVVFDDGQGGTFTINMHVPQPDLQRRLYMIREEVKTAIENRDTEKLIDLDREWSEHLAALCVDPEYSAEFWREGRGFDVDVTARLMNVAMGLDVREQEAARSFRKVKTGTNSSADA